MSGPISINSFKNLQCRFVPQDGAFSPKVCRDSLQHRLAFWHQKPKTVTKAIRNERPHWAGLLSGLYSLFSSKYLPFSWTCHHLYQPLFKPWPWTDGPKPLPFNTNCCPTNICYIYGRRAPRAHQDTCLTLWGGLRFRKLWQILQATVQKVPLQTLRSLVLLQCFTALIWPLRNERFIGLRSFVPFHIRETLMFGLVHVAHLHVWWEGSVECWIKWYPFSSLPLFWINV